MRKLLGAVLFLAFGAAGAFAQDQYPSRNVRIIVPSPPGGVTDILGRVIGQAVSIDRTLAANGSLIVATGGSQTQPVLVGSSQLAAAGAVDGFLRNQRYA